MNPHHGRQGSRSPVRDGPMTRSTRQTTPTAAIGQRIRSYRLERHVTQTELARQIGIQQSDLSRMEKGEYRVPLDVLFRILHALELTMGQFFGDLAQGGLTTTESTLLESFRVLSPAARDEVLEFIEFKRSRE
jgi:transcriptional regulator with XRE-family HTH domain